MSQPTPTPQNYLDFERPLLDIDQRIQHLQDALTEKRDIPEKNIPAEIERMAVRRARVSRLLYRNLTPMQKVQVARHPDRPHAADYVAELFTHFEPLAGDRRYGEDAALIAGLGRLKHGALAGKAVAVLGIDKGKTTQERIKRNFGMPRPEGYRKAQRILQLADKFNLPVVNFIDTPGAYPGVEAEARGQGEAIARSLEVQLDVDVPTLSLITGEGGSGGALALAVADVVLMLEHSIYSVISPEGCASILWKEATKTTIPQAAEALKLTAQDLQKLGVIDGIIKEPVGAAHRDPALTLKRVAEVVDTRLAEILATPPGKHARRQKFLKLGTA